MFSVSIYEGNYSSAAEITIKQNALKQDSFKQAMLQSQNSDRLDYSRQMIEWGRWSRRGWNALARADDYYNDVSSAWWRLKSLTNLLGYFNSMYRLTLKISKFPITGPLEGNH